MTDKLRKSAQDVVECWFENRSVQEPIESLAEALQAEPEPVCYITQSAFDSLTSGKVSSVRVWRKPDERLNGDIALYTKENGNG